MSTQRVRPIRYKDWLDAVLNGDRRERIDKAAATLGEPALAAARAAFKRRDVHAVDAELKKLGVHV
jgi:hypothetical protein